MHRKTLLALAISVLLGPLANAGEQSVRLVVTGTNAEGKAIIQSDGAPALMLQNGPGSYMGDLWKTDVLPRTHSSGEMPTAYELEPAGAGGVKFRIASIPPQTAERPLKADDEFGMHQTDTLDFITVISGEMYARMDSGEEVLLRPGDALVQRGTNHAWINRGSEPCVFSAVMIKPAIASGKAAGQH